MSENSGKTYQFGEFRLDAAQYELLKDGLSVDIKPKAFEILLFLVQNAGQVVTKEEIFKRVWAGSFVEETNLTHHIFNLRRALGETEENKFIVTVPKRGYKFVAPVACFAANNSRDEFPSLEARDQNTSSGTAPQNKYRFGLVAIPLVLLLVLGGLLFAFYQFYWNEKKSNTANSAMTRENMTLEFVTNSGIHGGATISPDGKFISYKQNGEAGTGILFVRPVESNTERNLYECGNCTFGASSFSPDGTAIYFVVFDENSPGGRLSRVSILGDEAVKLIEKVRNSRFLLTGVAPHIFARRKARQVLSWQIWTAPEKKR